MHTRSGDRRRQAVRDEATDAAFKQLREQVASLESRVLELQHTVVDLTAGAPVLVRR